MVLLRARNRLKPLGRSRLLVLVRGTEVCGAVFLAKNVFYILYHHSACQLRPRMVYTPLLQYTTTVHQCPAHANPHPHAELYRVRIGMAAFIGRRVPRPDCGFIWPRARRRPACTMHHAESQSYGYAAYVMTVYIERRRPTCPHRLCVQSHHR